MNKINKNTKKSTMYDVAKMANVSVATVSRVINSPHKASFKTQSKVNHAITKLNYDITKIITTYSTAMNSKRILVIDNQLISGSLINQGLEDTAREQGYKILYLRFLYFTEHEIQQIISYTLHNQIEGIIFINNAPHLEKIHQFRDMLPPLVILNHFSLQLPCVYFDHLAIAYSATQYFIQQGHSKIACLLGAPGNQDYQYMKKGYIQALQRANISFQPEYMIKNCLNFETVTQAVKKLMLSTKPPSALFCNDNSYLSYHDEDSLLKLGATIEQTQPTYLTTNTLIHGVIHQIKKMNIQVPQMLSIIHVAQTKQTQYHNIPQYTYVYKPLYKMGKQGVQLLLSQLKQTSPIIHSYIIDSEIIVRHSVSKADKPFI